MYSIYIVFSYIICPVYCSIDIYKYVSICANKETIINILETNVWPKQDHKQEINLLKQEYKNKNQFISIK